MPGMFVEFQFDDTLLFRSADDRVDFAVLPVEVQDGALAIGVWKA